MVSPTHRPGREVAIVSHGDDRTGTTLISGPRPRDIRQRKLLRRNVKAGRTVAANNSYRRAAARTERCRYCRLQETTIATPHQGQSLPAHRSDVGTESACPGLTYGDDEEAARACPRDSRGRHDAGAKLGPSVRSSSSPSSESGIVTSAPRRLSSWSASRLRPVASLSPRRDAWRSGSVNCNARRAVHQHHFARDELCALLQRRPR